MSAAEITARKSNLTIGMTAICILVVSVIVARAPVQDEADDQAARVHVEQGKAGK